MGLSLLLPKGTETAMFPHQTPLFMCTILLPSVLSQTFFQTNHGGAGGSFTSFSLGAATANLQSASYVPQPKPVVVKQPAYSAPQPTYSQATTYVKPQPAYIQPKTYIQPQTYAQPQTYSAPKSYAPQPTSYHHTPKSYPAPQGPKPAYGDKCTLDYVDEKAEICIPTFKADCSREEESKPGLMVRQEKECHTITRTICVEREEVEENEICAYSFHPVPVDTEVKLADVKWEKLWSPCQVHWRVQAYLPPKPRPIPHLQKGHCQAPSANRDMYYQTCSTSQNWVWSGAREAMHGSACCWGEEGCQTPQVHYRAGQPWLSGLLHPTAKTGMSWQNNKS